MSRGVWFRLLLVLGLLGGCAALALTQEPRLGLDLRGGTQITLQASSTDRVEANAESTDRAIEVLRGRVDALGISEPTLTRAGDDRIIVELPDVQDPREAVETIGRTAQLTMHPVVGTVGDRRRRAHGGGQHRAARRRPGRLPRAGAGRPRGRGHHQRRVVAEPQPRRPRRRRGVRRQRVPRVRRALGHGRLRRGRPAPHRDRARRRDHLLARGAGPVRRTHHRLHRDLRQLQRPAGGRPGHPDRGRRPARPGRGHRAAHGRAHAGRRRDQGVLAGRPGRAGADRAVHRDRLPAGRLPGDARAVVVRPARLRDPRRPRLDADAARAGRLRARHRAGHRRQRAGLRARPGGVRRPSRRPACAGR